MIRFRGRGEHATPLPVHTLVAFHGLFLKILLYEIQAQENLNLTNFTMQYLHKAAYVLIMLGVMAQLRAQPTQAQRQRIMMDDARARAASEFARQGRGERQEENNGSGAALWLLGGAIIAAAVASQQQAQPTSRSRSSRSSGRRISRPTWAGSAYPTKAMLSTSMVLHKTPINEHWQSGAALNYDARIDYLLLGIGGGFPNAGLYASGFFTKHRYRLPYGKEQYALGHDFVNDATPGLHYHLAEVQAGSGFNSKLIQFQEESISLGLSFKAFFKGGFFMDVGTGIKVWRSAELRFERGYTYLNSQRTLKDAHFDEVATITKTPFIFKLPHTYAEAGLGMLFDSGMLIRVSGQVYQLDYQKAAGYQIFHLSDGGLQEVGFHPQLGYSISLGIGGFFQ